MDNNISRIFRRLDHFDGTYPREAVEEAYQRKDEFIPIFIEELKRLLADPDKYSPDEHFANVFAFIFLGHFRETRAHDLILKITTLPEDCLDELFGDMITEDFNWIFYATSGGSLDKIKELALDKSVFEYSRIAAAEAIMYAVLDGAITRKEAFDFFIPLLSGEETNDDSTFLSGIANIIYKLYPGEVMDVIKKAYDNDLIDTFLIDYSDFVYAMKQGEKSVINDTKSQYMGNLNSNDIHSYISGWAAFNK